MHILFLGLGVVLKGYGWYSRVRVINTSGLVSMDFSFLMFCGRAQVCICEFAIYNFRTLKTQTTFHRGFSLFYSKLEDFQIS